MGCNLLLHVVIGVCQVEDNCPRTVFVVEIVRDLLEARFFGFKFFHIVVADDIVQACLLFMALDALQVAEPFIPFGKGRVFKNRKHGMEFHCDQDGIFHFALCRARMDAHPVDGNLGVRRVEVLIFDLAELAAVHRIGVLRPKALDIEAIRAAARLLVRRDADFDGPVRNVLRNQAFQCGENFRNACFIVRAEQRRAVGHDQILAFVIQKAFKFRRAHDDILFRVEDNIPAVVVLDDARTHILTAGSRSGVHMRDQSQNRAVGFTVGRQGPVDIAAFVHVGVGQAQAAQLLRKRSAQDFLTVRCRAFVLRRIFVGGGMVTYILQQSLVSSHFIDPLSVKNPFSSSYAKIL